MKIYATADIHGRLDRIELIRKTISVHEPEILVIAGDISNYTNPAAIFVQLNDLPIPVLAIRGNTDLRKVEGLLEEYENISSLHLNEKRIGSTSFIGISGTIPVPFRSRLSFKEENVVKQVEPYMHAQSVLVVHPPPWGILDEVFGRFHAGSKRLRDMILQHQPLMVLCGHIHERPGTAVIGRTVIVNCSMGKSGAGSIIECRDHKIMAVHRV